MSLTVSQLTKGVCRGGAEKGGSSLAAEDLLWFHGSVTAKSERRYLLYA